MGFSDFLQITLFDLNNKSSYITNKLIIIEIILYTI